MSLTTIEKVLLAGAVGVIALTTACTLRAADAPTYPCPPKVTSCKIVVITDQEEQTLVGPDMIFAHAQWANRVKLDSLIQAWVEKLRQAPQGVVQTDKPEEKK